MLKVVLLSTKLELSQKVFDKFKVLTTMRVSHSYLCLSLSERRNRTLLDMVRSMMSLTDLPLSFWGYALETAAFTLNRAPSKSVETTPYELWFGKKPKLLFLKVWGCDAYVKKLQPDKLEPKSEKCVFIGYPKETIGYTFYHRSEGKTFVAKFGNFLEKEFLSKEVVGGK